MGFGKWRSRQEIHSYFLVEWKLLKQEWPWIVVGALMQYIHSIFTNIAYHIQTKLSDEQRFPLHDLGHEFFPEVSDTVAALTEVLVFGGLFLPLALFFLSIPLLRQSPENPRFIVIIGKRTLFALSITLLLRILSFLGTALPGPASHCTVVFDEACLNSNPISKADCVIPNEEFKPPEKAWEYFGRVDAISGCGDLMFSSHTMYTLTFILVILKYWYHKAFLAYAVVIQTSIALLIVAARKHYTLDVFTALYVVPMVWFLLEAYHCDINHADNGISVINVQKFYGVNLREEMEEFSILPESIQDSCESNFDGGETPYIGSSNEQDIGHANDMNSKVK